MKVFRAIVPLIFAVCGTAQAADSSWYVGLDIGKGSQSEWKTNATNLGIDLAASGPFSQMTSTIDEKSTGYVLFAGRRTGNIALEVIVANSGTFSAKYVDSVPPNTVNATLESSYSAFGMAIAGFLPISESFELSGKVGFGSVKEKVDFSGTSNFASATASESDTGTGLILGVGVSYKATPSFAVSLNYTGFTFSRESGDNETVSLFGVGGRVNF